MSHRKGQRRLILIESDRLSCLARMISRATQVLGSAEKAEQWLMRPSQALGGETALRFLDTDIDARQIETVLGRIEHGIFS
ncbi:MAG: antitoxin Xre/MbcA/ParS toxin-binding domain-containing protein [Terriglobia bacterium]